ncbi:MAG TPA: diacylglycerol kinase family protein [Anaerolineaceae bacterium]|nr:diacylglycerol kinase family protein [Anaerolineaceae bacterium]
MNFYRFIKSRIKSFVPAINGIRLTIENEKNTWVHLIATAIALVAIFLFKLNYLESLFILSAVFIVWICEFFNTAIEYTLDFISIENNPKIKNIKDVSAAGVFLSVLYALIVAIYILLNKLIS